MWWVDWESREVVGVAVIEEGVKDPEVPGPADLILIEVMIEVEAEAVIGNLGVLYSSATDVLWDFQKLNG